jgi:predicted dehydrogenase
MDPVRLIVVGAGSRGSGYATYAQHHPEELQIVGVAEPRTFYRERLADDYDIPYDNVSVDWRELAARPRFADGVIITTQDAMHAEPAVAFANLGYHVLLEKPMAPNPDDCRRIIDAAKRNDIIFAVCHVMRYTSYTQQLKAILDAGRIGEIVSIEHLEPVGYWHQAHSFVRGNWRNEAESSPMLLAKSCHDLDWLRYLVGQPCVQVSSFGSLKHFRPEERPEGAADRCLECPVEPVCPYSAVKIYLGRVRRGETGWPVNVLTPDVTVEGVTEALRTGPYGRCVYGCDNDVVDHQVVNLLFANGATAAFTMTAFTRQRDRETHIFGTRGEIYGNGSTIEIYDFLTDQTETIQTDRSSDGSILTGHGGGDYGLMQRFVTALATGDRSQILSGPDETLETHLMVFAAEAARHEGRVAAVTL